MAAKKPGLKNLLQHVTVVRNYFHFVYDTLYFDRFIRHKIQNEQNITGADVENLFTHGCIDGSPDFIGVFVRW